MAVTRLENVAVLTMVEGTEPLEAGMVEWEDGVVRRVGPMGEAGQVAADEVLDGTGCVAMPGLVNAHTHLAMVLLRGFADDMPLRPWLEEKIWPTEAKLEEADVYWGTRLGVLELLRGGVTCFGDMYHYYEAATRAAVDGGIRACPSGVLLGFLPGAEERLARALEFTARARESYGDRIHPMLGPHALYTCPDALLQAVKAGAQAQGLPVHIHLSETASEVSECVARTGVSPVRHLENLGLLEGPTVAAHCVWLDEADVEILARRQVGVAHCPGSNMKLASGFAPVPELLRAGARVALGTDGAASNNNLDMFEEMLLAALIHKGRAGDPTVVRAADALAMATREGARALGLGDVVGTLEPGKRADLAVVDLRGPHLRPRHHVESHLVYAAGAADVRMTVIQGVVVMRDGQFPGQDAAEVYAQAEARSARLCGP
jgi:5-methylthioadenosine/S-adenosylhomocysteine deaminase